MYKWQISLCIFQETKHHTYVQYVALMRNYVYHVMVQGIAYIVMIL